MDQNFLILHQIYDATNFIFHSYKIWLEKKHPVPSNLTLSLPNPFGIYLCTGGADLDTLELWPSEDVFNFLGSPPPSRCLQWGTFWVKVLDLLSPLTSLSSPHQWFTKLLLLSSQDALLLTVLLLSLSSTQVAEHHYAQHDQHQHSSHYPCPYQAKQVGVYV